MDWERVLVVLTAAIVGVMISGPPILLGLLYFWDRHQVQHAVLRNFPVLGRIRYLLEHVGPELRQYLFDANRSGKPFSRDEYTSVVLAGKYLKSLIGFGSQRDFQAPGWYLRNALLPVLMEDMGVIREPRIETRRYRITDEGLFSRHEAQESHLVGPWLLSEDYTVVVGGGLPQPWRLRGLVGMSAMSYGALGRNAIRALSMELGRATGTWMNTGEGGLSEHHLVGGGDVIFQVGPGLFGVRDDQGRWDWQEFRRQAEL